MVMILKAHQVEHFTHGDHIIIRTGTGYNEYF